PAPPRCGGGMDDWDLSCSAWMNRLRSWWRARCRALMVVGERSNADQLDPQPSDPVQEPVELRLVNHFADDVGQSTLALDRHPTERRREAFTQLTAHNDRVLRRAIDGWAASLGHDVTLNATGESRRHPKALLT